MSPYRIIGIDPGLNVTGYGIIELAGDASPQLYRYGHIKTNGRKTLSERIFQIYSTLNELILEHHPQVMAIEDIFYAENVKTAIVMGHARGAAMVAGMNNGLNVYEYTAREVKMSVVGNGAASKAQVKFMVQRLLNQREAIKPDDASDALAVAICHWHRQEHERRIGS